MKIANESSITNRFAINEGTIPSVFLNKKLSAIADSDFNVVSIWSSSIEKLMGTQPDLHMLRDIIQKSNLKIIELAFLKDWLFEDGDSKKRSLVEAEKLCNIANIIGAEYICAATFGAEGCLKLASNNLADLCSLAANYNVKVAFEFLPWQKVKNINIAYDILEKSNMKNCGLLIDTFHFFMGDSKISDLDQIDPDKIALIHLCDFPNSDINDLLALNSTIPSSSSKANLMADFPESGVDPLLLLAIYNRILPGEGYFDLINFVKKLEQRKYSGYYCLEVLNKTYLHKNTQEILTSGMNSMLTLFKLAELL